MALYAFDGTWNIDQGVDDHDTNVRRFYEISAEPSSRKLYTPGVGTRLKVLGHIIGGVFGAGSFSRVKNAYEHLKRIYVRDEPIDVIGFSRGSALALDFINRIVAHQKEPEAPQPTIRFVGLFDVVGSFGLPINVGPFRFQSWNLGHRVVLPAQHVKYCFHALALDERRQTFSPTRLAGAHEVWFRGVHSDVGGGNGNTKLSYIPLRWMIRKAAAAAVRLDPSKLQSLKLDVAIDGSAPLRLPRDFYRNDFRRCVESDRRHYSVQTVMGRSDAGDCNPHMPTAIETELDEVAAQPVGGLR